MDYAKILDKQIEALNTVTAKMADVVVYDTNRLGVENLNGGYMNSYIVFVKALTKMIDVRLKCPESVPEKETRIKYNHTSDTNNTSDNNDSILDEL